MTVHARLSRPRAIALVTGVILSLSQVTTPAVLAQETPGEALASVFTAIEQWRFDEISDFFCFDQQSAAEVLDFGGELSSSLPGVTIEQVQAAIQFTIDGPDVEILAQDETTAHVHFTATMSVAVDEEAARAMVVALFASLGQDDAPDIVIDPAVQSMREQLEGEITDIDEEADIVFEDGTWKVCSPVGLGAGDGGPDEADADPVSAGAGSASGPG